MEIIVLASGSKGNATYIKTDKTELLIDAGISYKQIITRLQNNNITIKNLDGILLTHEHSDHIKGLEMIMKKTSAMLYTAQETFDHLYINKNMTLPYTRYHAITSNKGFYLNDLYIEPLTISHDASNALGYIITYNQQRLVYMTDVGYLPKTDYQKIANADAYIFEANYDVSLLFSSERPYYLKKRIDSVKGHLSNADAAYHLTQLIGENTKTLVLAHPSEQCNTKTHVLDTFKSVFSSYNLPINDYEIIIAEQHLPTKLFKL